MSKYPVSKTYACRFVSFPASVSNATVANSTADAALYRTVRTGPAFAYYLNLANGYYLVNLLFAEGQFTQAGQRQFAVAVQVCRVDASVSTLVLIGPV